MNDLPMSTQAAELMRQRDHARDIAVTLEQQLARMKAALDTCDHRPWTPDDSLGVSYCVEDGEQWPCRLRAALEIDA